MDRDQRAVALVAVAAQQVEHDLTRLRVEGRSDLITQKHRRVGHQLDDKFYTMMEDNRLSYVTWEFYSKREDEVTGAPKIKDWTQNDDGTLKIQMRDSELRADIGSDLRIKFALTRYVLLHSG